jgi:hypothetical protein
MADLGTKPLLKVEFEKWLPKEGLQVLGRLQLFFPTGF